MASTVWPTSVSTWARVRALTSSAKSASRMRDSLAVTFSKAVWRLRILVCSVLRSKAPSRPRITETCVMDCSRMALAAWYSPAISELPPPALTASRNPMTGLPRRDAETDWMPKLTCWLDSTTGPSWKVAPPPVIEKLVVPSAVANVSDNCISVLRVLERSLTVVPSPNASDPLTRASTSSPVSR